MLDHFYNSRSFGLFVPMNAGCGQIGKRTACRDGKHECLSAKGRANTTGNFDKEIPAIARPERDAVVCNSYDAPATKPISDERAVDFPYHGRANRCPCSVRRNSVKCDDRLRQSFLSLAPILLHV